MNLRDRLITIGTKLLRPLGGNSAGTRPPARRIVLLKPCCLGDVLLTTPLLAALRAAYPDARITYAVGRWSRPMVEHSAHVDELLELPDRWTPGSLLAVAAVLRRRGYDLAVVPDRSPVLSLLTLLARIPARAGLDSAGRGFAYTHRAPLAPTVEHEADVYNRVAAALDVPVTERRLRFFPTPDARQQALELVRQLPEGPLVALHAGGGSNPGMQLPRKRWLPERWAAVADTLAQQGARVLLLGGPGDEAAVEALARAMRQPATPLVRRWRWDELAALLSHCALFGGHDTGMMHLAVAVGTPTLAVFGPSDAQVYGPYGEHGVAVWRPTKQSPCFYEGSAVADCPCASQCMRNIEVEHVLAAVERLGVSRLVRSE